MENMKTLFMLLPFSDKRNIRKMSLVSRNAISANFYKRFDSYVSEFANLI